MNETHVPELFFSCYKLHLLARCITDTMKKILWNCYRAPAVWERDTTRFIL